VSPPIMFSDKSKVELEKPSSRSVAKDPGRNRGIGMYAVERVNKLFTLARVGM
jgi:hypothetical protein